MLSVVPSTLHKQWLTPRNAAILAAIGVALPAGWLFQAVVEPEQAAILLLLTVGVGVPTAHEGFGPESVGGAVAWVLAVSVAVTALFVGVYVAVRAVTGQVPAAAAAFVLGYAGPAFVAGYLRRRPD